MPGRLVRAVAALVATCAAAALTVPAAPASATAGGPSLRPYPGTVPVGPTASAAPALRSEPVTVIRELPEPTRRELRQARRERQRERLPEPVLSPDLTVRVISFNVLGSSHTRGRGGRPSGVTRIGGAAQLVRDTPLVGLQELQNDQAASLMRRLPAYSIFPGNSMERRASHNSVIWRSDLFTPVEQHVIGIPYHRGRIWPMPYVRLRHVSGTELWFANFHNPASTRKAGNNARWRRVAVQKEIELVRRLHADGTPVIMTGDFNDRAEFFCPIARSGVLEASNGGDAGPGFCRVPAGAPIDWIVGTPDITWSGYTVNRSRLVGWTSDHPLVAATATLPGQVLNEEELAAAGVDADTP